MKRVVVTGAFSYTGAAVAHELLARGHAVHTLTNRDAPGRCEGVTKAPLVFDAEALARELTGADAFVNTYWVRLARHGSSFDQAVAHSRMLVDAAARAGARLIHLSVSNAAAGMNLGYYRGKAQVEDAVRASGVRYAIVRPTLIVGPADVLTNNIAWLLRRFPLFLVPAATARVQPVTLADVGRIVADAVEADALDTDAVDTDAVGTDENREIDAAGPEVLTFAEYIRLVREAIGKRSWSALVPVPDGLALAALGLVQPFVRDVILTREELLGLKQELLLSHEPARGRESVADWLMQHGADLGRRYANDVDRRVGRARTAPVIDPSTLRRAAIE